VVQPKLEEEELRIGWMKGREFWKGNGNRVWIFEQESVSKKNKKPVVVNVVVTPQPESQLTTHSVWLSVIINASHFIIAGFASARVPKMVDSGRSLNRSHFRMPDSIWLALSLLDPTVFSKIHTTSLFGGGVDVVERFDDGMNSSLGRPSAARRQRCGRCKASAACSSNTRLPHEKQQQWGPSQQIMHRQLSLEHEKTTTSSPETPRRFSSSR
jgi:hypothetical protein